MASVPSYTRADRLAHELDSTKYRLNETRVELATAMARVALLEGVLKELGEAAHGMAGALSNGWQALRNVEHGTTPIEEAQKQVREANDQVLDAWYLADRRARLIWEGK